MQHEYGASLKKIRTTCHPKSFSVQYVLDQVNRLGFPISLATYCKWERGERCIPSVLLPKLAKVLGVTESKILNYDYLEDNASYQGFMAVVHILNGNQMDALNWVALKWKGNTMAVMPAVAMYLSLSPLNRLNILRLICSLYEQAQANGKTNSSSPPIAIQYAQDSLGILEEQVKQNLLVIKDRLGFISFSKAVFFSFRLIYY